MAIIASEAMPKGELRHSLATNCIQYMNNRPHFHFPPFANKLIQAGYIDTYQMREALAYIRQSDRSLLQFLEEVTGRQLTPELLREYKKYYLFI
jgi:hypothetical protein